MFGKKEWTLMLEQKRFNIDFGKKGLRLGWGSCRSKYHHLSMRIKTWGKKLSKCSLDVSTVIMSMISEDTAWRVDVVFCYWLLSSQIYVSWQENQRGLRACTEKTHWFYQFLNRLHVIDSSPWLNISYFFSRIYQPILIKLVANYV